MKVVLILSVLVLLTGCINLDLRMMVPDKSVKPAKTGEDCTLGILLPILIGTNTVEKAMANAGYSERLPNQQKGAVNERFISTPITKVHSIELQERVGLFYREVCIQVKGE